MNNIRNKQGVTLIALVVTIVVLLILAGASIAMLTGENGVIRNAKQASDENKMAQYEEEIRQIINEERIERSTKRKEESFITSIKLKIEERDWVSKVLIYDELQLIVETKDGYEIIVDIDNENNVNRIKTDKLTERYTITYDSNGASEGAVESHTNCRNGDNIILRENRYTKQGFTFLRMEQSKRYNR